MRRRATRERSSYGTVVGERSSERSKREHNACDAEQRLLKRSFESRVNGDV
jgi:hypothetical protein